LRYLVTGGFGFIGSHVVGALVARGVSVRVIDNFATGRRENLAHVREQIEVIEGDIRSYERAHAAVHDIDCVVHLAALPSVPRSVQDPLTTNEVNVTGTLNLLLAARDAGVVRFVLASSSSVYGANKTLPKREEMTASPVSPYGVSKLAAERYAMAFSDVYGLDTVALRYFNVFGPRQDPNSQYSGVVALFLEAAKLGREATVYGDGTQTRDFTFVSNVVDATLLAADTANLRGTALNVACGRSSSILDLVSAIETATGRSIRLCFRPTREGDVPHSCADISRARAALGYEPLIGFQEGIALTCAASEASV
jgi:nucleoside-diphosphate-sugar epimerase